MLWDIFLYHIIVMGLLAGPRMQVAFVAYVLRFLFLIHMSNEESLVG